MANVAIIDQWLNGWVSPLAATLTDDFSAGSVDTSKWAVSGTPSLSGGQLHIPTQPAYPGLASAAYYNIAGSSAYVAVIQTGLDGQSETIFQALVDPASQSNRFGWVISYGSVGVFYRVSNVPTISWTAWDPVAMKYLRVREASGTLYWDYSADGVTWTLALSSVANPFGTTAFAFQLQAGNYGGITTDQDAIFDNFNTLATNATVVAVPAKAVASAPLPTVTAFPSTAGVDNFNRTENPLSLGGAWDTTLGPYGIACGQTNGTQALSTAADNTHSGSTWLTTCLRPFEVFCDLPVIPATGRDFELAWFSTAHGPTPNGYLLAITPTAWTIYSYASGAGTSRATGSVTWSNGDSVGMSVDANGKITAYRKTGGVWAVLGSVVNTTYTSAAYLSWNTNSSVMRVDNFGGGYSAGANTVLLTSAAGTASAPAPAPVVSLNATISAPAASATATAPIPTSIAIASNLTLTAVPASSVAATPIPVPSISLARAPPSAGGTSTAPVPTIAAVRNITLSAGPASATAATPGPSIRTDATITTPSAGVTATAPIPTVSAITNRTIVAVSAGASSSASVPALRTDDTVAAPYAQGQTSAPLPTLAIVFNASVTAVPAPATASASIPALRTDASLSAPSGSATSSAPIPAVLTGTSITLSAVPAPATSSAPVPALRTDDQVTAPSVSATSSAPIPGLTATRNVTLASPSAQAQASASTPTISVVESATVSVPAARVTASASPSAPALGIAPPSASAVASASPVDITIQADTVVRAPSACATATAPPPTVHIAIRLRAYLSDHSVQSVSLTDSQLYHVYLATSRSSR